MLLVPDYQDLRDLPRQGQKLHDSGRKRRTKMAHLLMSGDSNLLNPHNKQTCKAGIVVPRSEMRERKLREHRHTPTVTQGAREGRIPSCVPSRSCPLFSSSAKMFTKGEEILL